jgi:hypothetical protein
MFLPSIAQPHDGLDVDVILVLAYNGDKKGKKWVQCTACRE